MDVWWWKIKEMRKFREKKARSVPPSGGEGTGGKSYRKLTGVHSCVGQIIRVYRHASFFVCACWRRCSKLALTCREKVGGKKVTLACQFGLQGRDTGKARKPEAPVLEKWKQRRFWFPTAIKWVLAVSSRCFFSAWYGVRNLHTHAVVVVLIFFCTFVHCFMSRSV